MLVKYPGVSYTYNSRYNPRSSEYDEYLRNHIANVQLAWETMLCPAIMNNLDEFDCTVEELTNAYEAIKVHDESKYNEDEYIPYCNFFYPCEGFEKDKTAFDYAWLLHQKRNPHHWQYWILVTDDEGVRALDMPFEEVCNMVCDWHSFSKDHPKSTAYTWYMNNKKNMQLSDNTRQLVEQLVKYLQDPLT